MTSRHTIERDQWRSVVTAFGEANAGRLTRVDTSSSGRSRCLVKGLPLRALHIDSLGSELYVHVGDQTLELRRQMLDPAHMRIESDAAMCTLSILARDGTLLSLSVEANVAVEPLEERPAN